MTITKIDCSRPVYQSKSTNYRKIWELLDSTIFIVTDEDGHEVNGRVRHLLGRFWIYVNEHDKYQILTRQEVEDLRLAIHRK